VDVAVQTEPQGTQGTEVGAQVLYQGEAVTALQLLQLLEQRDRELAELRGADAKKSESIPGLCEI
jgi:hypothetical protein